MSDRDSDRRSAPMPHGEVLRQCRDIVLIFSSSQLTELFDHAGSALLDFADRAENNAIQGRFFEAMNLIARQRQDIEHRFRQQITHGFDDFGSINPSSTDREGDSDSELSLVAPEEMEESIASENLVSRATATYYPEIYALGQRLAAISGSGKLKDDQIPAAPHHLVHSFRRALWGIEVDVRIKVILYAMFDKFVVRQAKSLYDELNGTLKAAGILPNLKPVHAQVGSAGPAAAPAAEPKPTATAGPPDSQSAQTESRPAPTSLGEELFESILDLMSTRRTGRPGGRSRGSRAAVDPEASAAVSRQLVSALSDLQSHTRTQPPPAFNARRAGDIPNVEVDVAFIEKVKETLSHEREQVLSQVDRNKLAAVDADLIDLIGMLFEYMLNDPVLPNLAKALLSHLHTPYLKVALIDRRLLVDARHPARKLLDQMVESGSLWVDETNPHRGIFPSMQRVVDRVLQEFTDDVGLFEELVVFFEGAMSEQQRRTDTMEQRTKEAARGREKLQLAKGRAGHQIQRLLQAHALPQALAAFLERTWLDQLVFILLRDKDEDRSEAWRQAVSTADELAGLFAPDVAPAERAARWQRIPQLRERITEGVRRMGSYTHSTLDALFNLLSAPETWQDQPVSVPPQALAIAPGVPAAPAAAEAEPAASEQEQEIIKRLRKMKFGTWFEFRSDTGASTRRIKLSWLSPLTATCMFVDRSGMQAEIKTLHELAQEILAGRAKVIPRPKHPFIERALVSIRKVLQGDAPSGPEKPAGAESSP